MRVMVRQARRRRREAMNRFPAGRPPAMGVGAQFIAPNVDAPQANRATINMRDFNRPAIIAPTPTSPPFGSTGAGVRGLGVMNHARTAGRRQRRQR